MLSSDKLFRKKVETRKAFVVGLDISFTSTGMYFRCLDDNKKKLSFGTCLTTKKTDGSDYRRTYDIIEKFREAIEQPLYPVIAVCIEELAVVRTSGKTLQRAELAGCIKYIIRNEIEIPFYTVSAKGLKKFATGNGNSGKKLMLQAAADAGYPTANEDLADAFHAANLAHLLVNGGKPAFDYTRVNPKGYTF